MSVSIRSRLLLLVMSWALPAVAAGAAIVYMTAQAERTADERTLRATARALALVVDRELAQRATAARVLARQAEGALPMNGALDQQAFAEQAQAVLQGLGGWAELRLNGRLLVSGPGAAAPPADDAPVVQAALTSPIFTPLQRAADGTWYGTVVTPVTSRAATAGSVAVAIPAAALQRVIDDAQLPSTWFAAIIDGNRLIAARQPGGTAHAGRPISEGAQRAIAAAPEGRYVGQTLEGHQVNGYFFTLPSGWTFIASMPQRDFGGYTGRSVLQVAGGGLALLLLAIAGAVWVSRSISRPVLALERDAIRLQNGEKVQPRASEIAECETVSGALARASQRVLDARAELEQRVAAAVERTREAEQAAARNQRVEALGRLTGGVAHDFNNLLGVVSNSARLVQRHVDTLPALQVPVSATLRAVEAGQRLTQHLLRFAGRRPVRPQAVQPAAFLPETAELLRSVVGQRITVEIDVAPDTSAITVDTSELELALINLAINARDAMPEGGMLRVSAANAGPADVQGLPPDRYVVIAVGDSGSGIDPKLATQVFEPFVTTKPAGQGTGLGLAQVHGFCTQAGGTALLDSAPGRGTRVALVLPATPAAADAVAGPRSGFSPTHAQVAGLRVLLVEDNGTLAEVTQALLAANGCEVTPARSAADALERVEHADGAFDVVLSDVVMPGALDGIGLARELRRLRPDVPVVLMSGYSSSLASVRDFVVLRKPVAEEELLIALRDAVAGTARP